MKQQHSSHSADMAHQASLSFQLNAINPTFGKLTITIPKDVVNALFKQVSTGQKEFLHTDGFAKGDVPIRYIEENFMYALIEHMREFLFKYFVSPFLYKEIRERKLLISGDPRLSGMHVAYDEDARYDFDVSLFEPIAVHEWRYFPFKAPKRKKYKDLDRQVDLFVKEERACAKDFDELDVIHSNDWVLFTIELVNAQQKSVFDHEPLLLWAKIGDEDADSLLRTLFVGRKNGETFVSDNLGLQEIFTQQFKTDHLFKVEIKDVLHDGFFCFELFKKHFKCKTNKEMLQKLIEVFSYRNNLSQRRTTVEESLALLLSRHKFCAPKHFVLRQQEAVLERIATNPDYHVYKVQKDFEDRVQQLAEKQVKEALLLDQIAYNDNLIPSDLDMKTYLHLTLRPRAKEFIYFDPPVTRVHGKEMPICAEELRHTCMREKTVNHIIHHLTRK